VAASWPAIWGVCSAYYWTNDPFEDTLQTARFYVPAIGAISLLCRRSGEVIRAGKAGHGACAAEDGCLDDRAGAKELSSRSVRGKPSCNLRPVMLGA
jgi:hypothetical protein